MGKRYINSSNPNLTLEDIKDRYEKNEPISIKLKETKVFTDGKTRELEKHYIYEVEVKPKYMKDNIVKLIRNKYSINDELAILRQRDTKPSEFEEYFNYVESCKKSLKN